MLLKCVKHYHQWLCSAIPLKTKLGQISSDCIRIQAPSKRPSSGRLHPVSAVKERNRKGGKCKISRVLQSPVSSPQASPTVEAGNRLKQAQRFSTRRKVQNGNSRVHQDLFGSRGVGIVDRSIGRLPSHPHPPKLKEIPKVLPQVSGVPVHIPPLRAGHSPPGLYNDCKGSQANGPIQRFQTSPIPGRLADQVPVSGGSPSEHSGSGRTNPVLGVDYKSGKVRTETYSGVFVRGLRIRPRFSPCKTHSREMAQTSGFDPTTQVKTCFDCKMFDFANWVACLNGEDGPGGMPSHEAISVSSQGTLEISSVGGQPPSLDGNDFCTSRLVAKSCKRDERRRPSSERPQYPTLYRRLKRRLGSSIRSKFNKGSVVRSGKKATHKRPRVEGGLTGPSNIESQTHSRVSECDSQHPVQVQPSTVDRMVTASTGVQTNLSKVVHSSCRPVCHSSEPQTPSIRVSYPRPKGLGLRCAQHKLDRSHCLCLLSNGSPSQGDPKNQAMQLPDHTNSPRLARDALVLGPSVALNRDPATTPSVKNTSQTVPQLRIPQQSATSQPPRLVSRSGQLQEQGFSVEVAERIAAPQR